MHQVFAEVSTGSHSSVAITVRADEHLELNVSHALLNALMQAAPRVARMQAEAAAQRPGQDDHPLSNSKTHERGIDVRRSARACDARANGRLLNRTEMQLEVGGPLIAEGPHSLQPNATVDLIDLGMDELTEVRHSGGPNGNAKDVTEANHATTRCNPMLATAVAKGDEPLVRQLLERNANPNSTSARGLRLSALQMAARYKHVQIAALLIGSGARVETSVQKTGERALHLAAIAGSVPMVQLLIQRQANPLAVDIHGQTAWSRAQAAKGRADVEKLLGEEVRARLRVDGKSKYPEPALARLAAVGGHAQIAPLLKARADANSSDKKYTALQRACLAGAKRKGTALAHIHQTVRMLLDAGAPLDTRAPRPKAAGATALHIAATIGDQPIVDMLLSARADPTVANGDGKLPLDVAAKSVHALLRGAVLERALHVGWMAERSERRTLQLLKSMPAPNLFDRNEARRVHCVLLPSQLCCFTSDSLEHALHWQQVHLSLGSAFEGAVAEPNSEEFELRFSDDRPAVFVAASVAERDTWVALIRSAASGAASRPNGGPSDAAPPEHETSEQYTPIPTPQPVRTGATAGGTSDSKVAVREPANGSAKAILPQLDMSIGDLRAACDARALASSCLVLFTSSGDPAAITWNELGRTPAVGLVLESGPAHGGHRMLTARSPLQVRNEAGCEMALFMGPSSAGGGGSGSASITSECRVSIDQCQPLPVSFTHTVGTDAATWTLSARPNASGWRGAALRRWLPGHALLVCDSEQKLDDANVGSQESAAAAALPWIAIVSIHDQLLPVASASGTSTAEAAGESTGTVAGRARALRRFGLPASETLVETMVCLLKRNAMAAMAQLFITHGFLCYEQAGAREALAWSEVESLDSPRGFGRRNEIVASLSDGRELIFCFFDTSTTTPLRLRRLRHLRTHARRLLHSPAALWRPRELRVLAPLTLLSRLPFPISVALRQLEPTDPTAGDTAFGRALDNAFEGIRSLFRRGASNLSESEGGPPLPPPAPGAPPFVVQLPPNVPQRVHSFHARTTLRVRAWLGGPSYDDSLLHGHVDLIRPEEDGDEALQAVLRLHPRDQPLSSLSIDLVVEISASSALCATVTVFADHWLHNFSSLPIEVHGSRGGGKVVAADVADPSSPRAPSMLFSLEGDTTYARLAIGRDSMRRSSDASDGGGAPSAGEPSDRVGEPASVMDAVASRFSKPFRVTAGSDFDLPLAVPLMDGSGESAELSLSVSKGAGGSLVSVLHLHDRFVIRNSSAISIEWHEVGRGGSSGSGRASFSSSSAAASSWAGSARSLLGGGDREASKRGAALRSGTELPLRWTHGDDERLLALRPAGGDYEWSTPVSANEAGAFILKCRPLHPETGAANAYLRLSVQSVSASRMLLVVRSLRPDPQLPYRVINPSRLLVAFRQPFTRAWDVLGAGEWTAYTPDDPTQGTEQRRLDLMLFDPYGPGRAYASSSLDTKIALEEAGKKGGRLLNLRVPGPGKAGSTTAQKRTTAASDTTLPPLETLLLSAGGVVHYAADTPLDEPTASSVDGKADKAEKASEAGGGPRPPDGAGAISCAVASQGWVCVSQTMFTFIGLRADATDHRSVDAAGCCGCSGGGHTKQQQEKEQRKDGTTDADAQADASSTMTRGPSALALADGFEGRACGWVPLSQLPLSFDRIEAIERSSVSFDMLLLLTTDGAKLAITRLRDPAGVLLNLSSLLTAHRDRRYTQRIQRIVADSRRTALASAARTATGWLARARQAAARAAVTDGGAIADDRAQELEPAAAAIALQAAVRSKASASEAQRRRQTLARQPHPNSVPCFPSVELASAASRGDERLVSLLLQRRASADSFDLPSEQAALHLASAGKHRLVVELLLQAGADVELHTRDGLGQTALHIAAPSSWMITRMLLSAGADPTAKRACDGQTAAALAPAGGSTQQALHLAEERWRSSVASGRVQRPVLVIAARLEQHERLLLLLQSGTDPDSLSDADSATGERTTALHEAARLGDRTAVQMLLEARANPNAASVVVAVGPEDEASPSRAKGSRRGVVGLRKTRGRGGAAAATAAGGRSALEFAAASGSVGCVRMLLSAHADPLLPNAAGALPLFRCGEGARSRAVRELLLHAMSSAQAASAVSPSAGGSKGLSRKHTEGWDPSNPTARVALRTSGPIRELVCMDAEPGQVMTGDAAAASRAGGSAGMAVAPAVSSTSAVSFSLFLSRIGVAIVDDRPRDLLYLSLTHIAVDATLREAAHNREATASRAHVEEGASGDGGHGGGGGGGLSATASLGLLQIDSCVLKTECAFAGRHATEPFLPAPLDLPTGPSPTLTVTHQHVHVESRACFSSCAAHLRLLAVLRDGREAGAAEHGCEAKRKGRVPLLPLLLLLQRGWQGRRGRTVPAHASGRLPHVGRRALRLGGGARGAADLRERRAEHPCRSFAPAPVAAGRRLADGARDVARGGGERE